MNRFFIVLMCSSFFFSVSANELHDAVRDNDLDLLKKLLATLDTQEMTLDHPLYQHDPMDPDQDIIPGSGITPLRLAIQLGHIECVEAFLKVPNYDGFLCGGYPLHAACELGNFEITKMLLENGADVHKKSTFDVYTPLQYASEALRLNDEDIEFVESDFVSIVELLIQNGADPNKVKVDGEWQEYAINDTPLALAQYYERPKIVEILLKYGAKNETSTSSSVE